MEMPSADVQYLKAWRLLFCLERCQNWGETLKWDFNKLFLCRSASLATLRSTWTSNASTAEPASEASRWGGYSFQLWSVSHPRWRSWREFWWLSENEREGLSCRLILEAFSVVDEQQLSFLDRACNGEGVWTAAFFFLIAAFIYAVTFIDVST